MKWLTLTDDERKDTIRVVAASRGLIESAVEKDWWVSLALRAMFNSTHSKHLLFKGGTSLSKGWDLIARLSEDIDLVLDKQALGFTEVPSKTQIVKLRKQSEEFTKTELVNVLKSELDKLEVAESNYEISFEPGKEPDPQSIILNYKPLFEHTTYLLPRVKVEVSARSLTEPSIVRTYQSFIGAHYHESDFTDPAFDVATVDPKRTFLEKACLLHEEFHEGNTKQRHERMSRHLYDLERLMDTDHGKEAIADKALFDLILGNRQKFYSRKYIDYSTFTRGALNFIPPDAVAQQ